jgi:hypothetical protein
MSNRPLTALPQHWTVAGGEPIGTEAARWERPASVATSLAILIACAVAWFGDLDQPFVADFDEGVYLGSARLLNRGALLFVDVFASQPPLFFETLRAALRLCGDTVSTGRGMVVLAALVSLGAVGALASRMIAPRAAPVAMGLLATTMLFSRQASIVDAEIPALAFGLAALAVMSAGRSEPQRSYLLRCAVAGALFAGAGLHKLFVAPLVAPVLLLVTMRTAHDAAVSRPGSGAQVEWHPLSGLAAFVAAGLAVTAVALLPYDLRAAYDQIVAFHLEASRESGEPVSNRYVVQRLLEAEPLLLVMAAFGGLALVVRAPAVALWMAAWATSAVVFLLTHHPLFPRHSLVLYPVLALAGSAVTLPLTAPVATRVGAITLAVAVAAGTVVGLQRDLQWPWGEPVNAMAFDAEAVALIRAHARPDQSVVSDQPMLVFRSGRIVPAALSDPSRVRIASGRLPLATAIAATRDAAVVVLWTGRLSAIDGYAAWVADHFILLKTFGPAQRIYVQRPGPSAD